MFFVEEETGDMIAEALQLLRDWNPTWRPEHFMVDKTDAEQNTIGIVFGADNRVLLCVVMLWSLRRHFYNTT